MKKCFLFLFFILTSYSTAISQNMYAFVVIQNDPDIGSLKDKVTIEVLMKKVCQETGLNLVLTFLDDAKANESYVRSEIKKFRYTQRDVIWYYYSGHGRNYDTFPQSDTGELPLTTVDNILKEQNARLTIALYDCCAWREPLIQPRKKRYGRVGVTYYQELFLKSKGNIKIASCSSKQFSWGSSQAGSIFTNAFFDAVQGNATWREVLQEAKKMTEEMATLHEKVQNPQSVFSPNFIDGTLTD